MVVKQALLAYVNHVWIHSWNQPVLSNEGEVSSSRKQWEPLMGLKFTTDRHPVISSQMQQFYQSVYPAILVNPKHIKKITLLIYFVFFMLINHRNFCAVAKYWYFLYFLAKNLVFTDPPKRLYVTMATGIIFSAKLFYELVDVVLKV